MSNEITIKNNLDENILSVLKHTLYPDADDTTVNMIISYCQALKLDPMLKPVHPVPMNKKNKDGSWSNRMVVMPGIGLYRIQASRSNAYAGISPPKYGQDITEMIGKKEITYPKWCKVTVKRVVDGHISKFSAKEYWKENYAEVGGKENDISPNKMWAKRPHGQLAKCAEAQALRKAFPEFISSQPSAEEMEGKVLEPIKSVEKILDKQIMKPISIHEPAEPLTYRFAELDATFTNYMTSDETLTYLKDKIMSLKTAEEDAIYTKFKEANAAIINRYFRNNPKEAIDLGNTYKSQKDFIERTIEKDNYYGNLRASMDYDQDENKNEGGAK